MWLNYSCRDWRQEAQKSLLFGLSCQIALSQNCHFEDTVETYFLVVYLKSPVKPLSHPVYKCKAGLSYFVRPTGLFQPHQVTTAGQKKQIKFKASGWLTFWQLVLYTLWIHCWLLWIVVDSPQFRRIRLQWSELTFWAFSKISRVDLQVWAALGRGGGELANWETTSGQFPEFRGV